MNVKYILSLGIGMAVSATEMQAQQLPIFNEFSENMYVLNPAMTGRDNITAISASYRHQWTGMPEAPRTISLGVRTYAPKLNMGFGGYAWRDQSGPTTFTGGGFSYAYHIKLGSEDGNNKNRLAIGLNVSVMQYQLKGEELTFNTPGDPLQMSVNRSRILPDAGAGICYYNNWLYVGFSVPQMLSMKVRFEGTGAISNIQRVPHFYLMSGVKIPLGGKKEDLHFLSPTIWLKYAHSSPISANLGFRYFWKKTLGVGVGYATDGTVLADVNVNIKNMFRIGYAFSSPVNRIARHLGTIHEMQLSYVIKSHGDDWIFPGKPKNVVEKPKKKKPRKLKNATGEGAS